MAFQNLQQVSQTLVGDGIFLLIPQIFQIVQRKSIDSANISNKNIDILSLIINWLSTKRKDGEPRMLQLRRSSDANNNKLEDSSITEFINAIKKVFYFNYLLHKNI